MSNHSASESETFWYTLNPFKRTMRATCGKELNDPIEVSDPVDCSQCNSGNSERRPLI